MVKKRKRKREQVEAAPGSTVVHAIECDLDEDCSYDVAGKAVRRPLMLTDEELTLVEEALGSHAYWELSDPGYRNSGFVSEPGSDDPEAAEEIARCEELQERINRLKQGEEEAPDSEGSGSPSPRRSRDEILALAASDTKGYRLALLEVLLDVRDRVER